MKLNKKMIMLCIWVLSLLMTGCSAENSKKDTHNKETKGNEPQTVKIDEVDWNIDENIVDEKRCVVLDYTNNSNCTIVDFELSFKAKNDITDKEKEKFYQDIQKSFEFSDDDMSELKEKEISMSTGSERVVNPGESVDKVRCYYYSGYYYLNDISHYNLMQPDIATIKYISDGNVYTEYYDFISKKYSTEDKTEKAVQWSNYDIGNEVDKPEAEMIKVDLDDEDLFKFDVCGMSKDQYDQYVDACKEKGFTDEKNQKDDRYSANNEQGYSITLEYDYDDYEIEVRVSKEE